MSGRAQPRIFYGWIIVGVALIMNLASSPASAVTFGFFIRPMKAELGWSYGALALGLSFRLAVAGVTAPILGHLLDRFGTRVFGTAAAVGAGLSIMALGLVHDLRLFYLYCAISGLSGFGGPSGQLLTVVPVAKWFRVRRGWALAIATIGGPAGNVLLIPIAQLIIASYGWRIAWFVLGSLLMLIAAPLCAIFMRKDPESMGLHVDGVATEASDLPHSQGGSAGDDGSWSVRQVLRNNVFWMLLVSAGLAGIVTQGTLVLRVPFWQDMGIPSGYVALGTAFGPGLIVVSGLICGFLADRWAIRNIGILGGTITGLSVVPMIFGRNSIILLAAHNVLWGIGQGANNTVGNVIWPSYFGRQFLGSIRGLIFPVSIGTAAMSAPLFALLQSHLSEPRLVWIAPLVAFVGSGFLCFLPKPPPKSTGSPGGATVKV